MQQYLARLHQNLKKPDEVDFRAAVGIDAVEAAIHFVEENMVPADDGVIVEVLNSRREQLFVKVTTSIRGEYICKDLMKTG